MMYYPDGARPTCRRRPPSPPPRTRCMHMQNFAWLIAWVLLESMRKKDRKTAGPESRACLPPAIRDKLRVSAEVGRQSEKALLQSVNVRSVGRALKNGLAGQGIRMGRARDRKPKHGIIPSSGHSFCLEIKEKTDVRWLKVEGRVLHSGASLCRFGSQAPVVRCEPCGSTASVANVHMIVSQDTLYPQLKSHRYDFARTARCKSRQSKETTTRSQATTTTRLSACKAHPRSSGLAIPFLSARLSTSLACRLTLRESPVL